MISGVAQRLRAAAVEMVDRLVPKRMLRLALHPRLHAFIGLDRIDAVGTWIDNRFMLKRRQQRTQDQLIVPSTKAYLATRFCPNPFVQLETAQTGLAYVCCPVWLPTPIGSLDTPPAQLWQSAAAKEVRASILDGSFSHCNHLHCPSIANRTLPGRDSPAAKALIDRYRSATPPTLPEHLILSHDKSCNLSCPSCRGAVYMANASKQAKLDRLTEETLLPLMRHARSVLITGSGDPFGSKHFRNLIKRLNGGDYPDLRIDLISNGILWDRRAWAELKLGGRVRSAHISIDAATRETYAFCRRGGDFDRLLTNLAFVRELRLAGEIAALEFSMVVQARNFREMPAFVRLGEEFAADTVAFNMIRQRDIFSKEAFVEAFIGSPEHPAYPEFVETLKAPELAQPSARLGNIPEYVRRADAGIAV